MFLLFHRGFTLMAILFGFCHSLNDDDPIVFVNQGIMRGTLNHLLDGRKYYSFKGIPYAQPPIRELRFRDPLPPKPWNGIYNATKFGDVCPQFQPLLNLTIPGNEDCLFLNVYTRSLKVSNLPVIVFIHGGRFIYGSGDTYGPNFLLQHNVVIVTLNYRLELFGFLSLDTKEVPGNAGLKDQVAALKWVKKNIAQFGGDPNNITIYGQSSGSASVTYHMVSPITEGLFHKVIAQSGACIADWALQTNPVDKAFRATEALGYRSKTIDEVLKHLRSVPALDLVGLTFKMINAEEKHLDVLLIFSPVVEKRFEGAESFINEQPLDILVNGKTHPVPLMIGYNSMEGRSDLTRDRIIDKNSDTKYLVPREISKKFPDNKTRMIGKLIKAYYVGNQNFSMENSESFVNMTTDKLFSFNTNRFATFHANTMQPVFAYRFNYELFNNLQQNRSSTKGAAHGDDMYYFFSSKDNYDIYKTHKLFKEVVFNLTKIWTNFAKTGNPTPSSKLGVTWEPFNSSKNYMLLEEPYFSVGPNPDRDRLQFWNDLYCAAKQPCNPLRSAETNLAR